MVVSTVERVGEADGDRGLSERTRLIEAEGRK